MAEHRCHVKPCRNPCPRRLLTCRVCWSHVPHDIGDEVYRTVKLRGRRVDKTWAPWWRAQARAIDAVLRAGVATGRWTEAHPGVFDLELADALAFADYLEGKITAAQLDAVRHAMPQESP